MSNYQHYVLIGSGGTGGIVLPFLIRHAQKLHGHHYDIDIVDGDKVEDKNVIRQGYSLEDVGKFKADIAAGQPGSLHAFNQYLTRDNADRLIQERDIVIIAADNWVVRADVERRALELEHVTVINGGNEAETASCQIFMRRQEENLSPPLSYQHPEILVEGLNREEESCMVRAASPDNEQTIAANLMSAAWIMAALHHVESAELNPANWLGEGTDRRGPSTTWHELYADLNRGKAGGPDWRDMGTDDWKTWNPHREAVGA
jgi:molybdopterin/thiamine biosynthesis adenylyltransferase